MQPINDFATNLKTLKLSELIQTYGRKNKNNPQYLSTNVVEIFDRASGQVYQHQYKQPSEAQLYIDNVNPVLTSDGGGYKEATVKIEIPLNETVVFQNIGYNKIAICTHLKWYADVNGEFQWWRINTAALNPLVRGEADQWFETKYQASLNQGHNPFTNYQKVLGNNNSKENVLLINNYLHLPEFNKITYQHRSLKSFKESATLNNINQNQAINNQVQNQQIANQMQTNIQNSYQIPNQQPPNLNQNQPQNDMSLAGAPEAFDQYQSSLDQNQPQNGTFNSGFDPNKR